jgi:hypothetical protein
MPRFRFWYWELARYLANSALQAASESGGTAPVTGFHSVMDKPEPVSRVAPPTATMRSTRAASATSHARTSPAREARPGSASGASDECVAATAMGGSGPAEA